MAITHRSSVKLTFVVVGFLFCAQTARAVDETHSSAALAVYSDINFIETEREFVGLQIVLVPYSDGQQGQMKILWRSAGPFLNTPLLLDAVQSGNTYKVIVPQSDNTGGSWTLSLKGNDIYAVGPGSSKYSLKRISPR